MKMNQICVACGEEIHRTQYAHPVQGGSVHSRCGRITGMVRFGCAHCYDNPPAGHVCPACGARPVSR